MRFSIGLLVAGLALAAVIFALTAGRVVFLPLMSRLARRPG